MITWICAFLLGYTLGADPGPVLPSRLPLLDATPRCDSGTVALEIRWRSGWNSAAFGEDENAAIGLAWEPGWRLIHIEPFGSGGRSQPRSPRMAGLLFEAWQEQMISQGFLVEGIENDFPGQDSGTWAATFVTLLPESPPTSTQLAIALFEPSGSLLERRVPVVCADVSPVETLGRRSGR
ncbi:MAG TPA: hypothetical protein VGB52_12915 [Actinomycetota bacterium]